MISFITVNYNRWDVTCDLLESLRKHVTSTPWEVIVVDNGSKEDQTVEISRRCPWARTVRSDENLGFAGGNNLGVKMAVGDYFFFINNDTELRSDGVDALCQVFRDNPRAGMVCPKIQFFFEEGRIQYAGYTPLRGIRMKNEMIGYGKIDDGSYDKPSLTAFPHGAAMMVSRAAFEDVGPMPECYFLYYEELDWGMTFHRKGWTIHYEPSLTVYHKESLTTGQGSPLTDYYQMRGRQMFAWRNFSGLKRIGSVLFTRWVAVPKRAIVALLKSRPQNASAVLRANRDFRRLLMKGKL